MSIKCKRLNVYLKAMLLQQIWMSNRADRHIDRLYAFVMECALTLFCFLSCCCWYIVFFLVAYSVRHHCYRTALASLHIVFVPSIIAFWIILGLLLLSDFWLLFLLLMFILLLLYASIVMIISIAADALPLLYSLLLSSNFVVVIELLLLLLL